MPHAKYPKTYALQVGTKKQKLVAENKKRKYLFIYNNGTDTIYILSSPALNKDNGIPVPVGGSYNNEHCYGEYWVVAESGTQDIRVEEDTD